MTYLHRLRISPKVRRFKKGTRMPPNIANPVKGWEATLIFALALAALNWGIPAFFGAMPLVEQFGRFICQRLFGI